METQGQHPNIDILRTFSPLKDISREQLNKLALEVEIEQAPAGARLITLGSQDDPPIYLIDGVLRLTAEDGRVKEIRSGDSSSRIPISQLIPHRYEVTALTPVRYMGISSNQVQEIKQDSAPLRSTTPGYAVSTKEQEETQETSQIENHISYQFLQDLENDLLVLPSLPDVAIRISQAVRDDESDARKIADIVQTDPVITAKLIKAANSALYSGQHPIDSCSAAIVRLGTDVVHNLVITFAMKELFESDSGLLQRKMKALWEHSTKVAALCYVLATRDRRFNPEQAMLIGLLHDIGVVAILKYAGTLPLESRQPDIIDKAIYHLRAQAGGMILQKWGFSPEFVVAALEAEDWMRNQNNTPDYCDLVIIAQLHSFVGTEMVLSAPSLAEVPARIRLGLEDLSPRKSLKILDQAKEHIDHAISLLSI